MKRFIYISFLFLSFTAVAQQPTAKIRLSQLGLGLYSPDDYGAVVDDDADDATAFAAMQAAMVPGGRVIPSAGEYNLASSFNIIKTMTIEGAGKGTIYSTAEGYVQRYGTRITYTDNDSPCFIVSAQGNNISGIDFYYGGATPVAGNTAISNTQGQNFHWSSITIANFYDGLRVEDYGMMYSIDRVHIYGFYRYGMYLGSVLTYDSGDQNITSCEIRSQYRPAVAAIRFEGGGGPKISNLKINSSSLENDLQYGIDIYNTAGTTVDFLVTTASIEGISHSAIRVGGTATMHDFIFNSIQVGYWSETQQAPVIDITGPNVGRINIDNINVSGQVNSAYPVVKLTNVDNVAIGQIVKVSGAGADVAQTGSTNVRALSFAAPEEPETPAYTFLSNFNGTNGSTPVAETGSITSISGLQANGSGGMVTSDGVNPGVLIYPSINNVKTVLDFTTTITENSIFYIEHRRTNDANRLVYRLYHTTASGYRLQIYSYVAGVDAALLGEYGAEVGDISGVPMTFTAETTASNLIITFSNGVTQTIANPHPTATTPLTRLILWPGITADKITESDLDTP